MIYDYESETHAAVHVLISRMCHICHMFGVESTQSYQLTELRFQGSGKHNGSRRVSMLEIRVCTLTKQSILLFALYTTEKGEEWS